MGQRRKTYAIAIGGVLSAAAISLMSFGAIIPFATFITPALAAICVFYFCVEYSAKVAVAVFIVISVLSMLLSADKEQALIFAFVLGYFPIIKALSERVKNRFLMYLIKFGIFNIAVIGLYYVITKIIVIAAVRDEFATYSIVLIAGMLVLANVTLFFYDRVLTRLAALYIVKWRPKFKR